MTATTEPPGSAAAPGPQASPTGRPTGLAAMRGRLTAAIALLTALTARIGPLGAALRSLSAAALDSPLIPISVLGGFMTALALAILTLALAGPPGALWPAGRLALAPPGAAIHTPAAGHANDAPEEATPDTRPAGPDLALIEKGPDGPLPVISPDGRTPREVYARPFDRNDPRPRIAIVVTGLGLSNAVTLRAIETLPGEMTLALQAYGRGLGEWAEMARADGHEILLEVPMEPFDYPENDPGPYALLAGPAADDNLRRLAWLMSRVTGYAGLTNAMGSRMLGDTGALLPVFGEMNRRGLMFLDTSAASISQAPAAGRTIGLPLAAADLLIDTVPARGAVDDQLAALEQRAREHGRAIGIAQPLPVTLERLAAWAPTLAARGIVLAPVTAMTENDKALSPQPPDHAASAPPHH